MSPNNAASPKSAEKRGGGRPEPGVPQRAIYESNDVVIPPGFLVNAPHDARPVTIAQIHWAKTVLPENQGYAVVLDHVLSPSECEELLRLVESSVPESQRGESGDYLWKPAMVNVGGGCEVLAIKYRNSDRIIWDHQDVVDRLWARCLQAPGLWERLGVIEDDKDVLGPMKPGRSERWEFRKLNKRMRFLKYGKGQYFRREFAPASPRGRPGRRT
jgi:hypothetical protein